MPVNPDHPAQPLIDGQAAIAIMYNGDAAQAMRQNTNIRYVLPDRLQHLVRQPGDPEGCAAP